MGTKKYVGNTEFQKSANEALILDHLRRQGPLSRIDLAKTIGLRQSTVTYIVNRLVACGIIQEKPGETETQGKGRKPIPLKLNENFGYILGMDVGIRECRIVIADIVGTVRRRGTISAEGNAENFTEALFRYYEAAVALAAAEGMNILAIGVSVSGVVDTVKGSIKRSWAHGLSHFDIADALFRKLPIPALIENDANCCAFGKLWTEMKDVKNASFLYLFFRDLRGASRDGEPMLPINIALGMVLNGAMYRGASYHAGEFRSVSPDHPGMGQLSIPEADLAKICDDEGVKRRAIAELFTNIVLLLISLNPHALFIGGDLPFSEEWLFGLIDGEMKLRSKYSQMKDCSIAVSETAPYDAAFGACAYVLSTIYSIPRIGQRTSYVKLDWETILGSKPDFEER